MASAEQVPIRYVPSAQVHANLLDLEFDLPHFCSLFKEYAEAEAMSDGESLPGSSDGNGGVSDGESRRGRGVGACCVTV